MTNSMQTYWLEQTDADVPLHDEWLSRDEAVLLSRMRFAKRHGDWRLGRWTAKCAAAAYLNLPTGQDLLRTIEIRPSSSGAPDLFIDNCAAGAAISISHRAGRAVCAIAGYGAALGCDLESVEPRESSFVEDYFTNEEQELVSQQPEAERPRVVTLLWSAKESALKALRQGLRVDTRSVAAWFDSPKMSADGGNVRNTDLGSWYPLLVRYAGTEMFHGWWQSSGQMVRTLLAFPAPVAPVQLRLV